MKDVQHLRVARPTDDLDALIAFYTEALGFEKLGEFRGHEGFDGVMLGHPELPYHLEFTHARGHQAGRAPTQENLLVFYFADKSSWHGVIDRIENFGASPVKSFNPYWDRCGRTYEDPDGYRIVVHNGPWPIQAGRTSE
ncbi:MAG: VOC family protein [Planctomycetota bacterium]